MNLQPATFLVYALVCAIGIPLWASDSNEKKAVEDTLQALREKGFKTELSEFDFSASAEMQARAQALTNADLIGPGIRGLDYSRRSVLWQENPDLMALVGPDTATVIWKEQQLPKRSGEDAWSELREILGEHQTELDAACAAALSGPIGFDLVAAHGNHMLLPHLSALKNLCQLMGTRAVVDLHYGNLEAAWTNVLASTRLVTAWQPELVETSYLVRYACTELVYCIVWQALQAHCWSDPQLTGLQAEWEGANFFRGLPDTLGFTRASMVELCRWERQQPLPPGMSPTQMLQSPRAAWRELESHSQDVRYREHGTYEDEKALLLYYRDREIELRQALLAPSWSEMRHSPGATNAGSFQSTYRSRMQMMLNTRKIALGFQHRGVGLLGRAAEAEARRRILIVAIALERYRGRHGVYPSKLAELVPEVLDHTVLDFMDGQPLRHRLTDDGCFVLYSVGLDCVDNGGKAMRSDRGGGRGGPGDFGISQDTDLVWPHPAASAEVIAKRESENERVRRGREAEEKRGEALRQTTLDQLRLQFEAQGTAGLRASSRSKEPKYQGELLSTVIRNPVAARVSQMTLEEMLTLTQIITGQEPDIATFELPIRYDVVTKIGVLHLLVDAGPEPTNDVIFASSPEGRAALGGGQLQACRRATNGNCLLVWNTTYDPPGQHYLRAQLVCTEQRPNWRTLTVEGPLRAFYSTNVCQFDPFYSQFDSKGATLRARLARSNAVYTIELKSLDGVLLRTLKGTTTNGVIDVRWDLNDDRGNRCTNESINSVFHVTFPDKQGGN